MTATDTGRRERREREDRRRSRRRIAAIVTVLMVLVGGGVAAYLLTRDDDSKSATRSTTTTRVSVSSSSTASSSSSSAGSSSTSSSVPVPVPVPVPPPAATPEAYATALFDAWKSGNRGAAAAIASQAAIDALFREQQSEAAAYTFAGCQGAAGSIYCSWTRPGGQLQMQVRDATGGLPVQVLDVTVGPA